MKKEGKKEKKKEQQGEENKITTGCIEHDSVLSL